MSLQPLKALIVEDEALLAMELEDLLVEAGHEVVGWATTASEAIGLADRVEADVAFIDVHLADGSTGIEVAEHLRQNHAAVVVFLTANPKRVPENFTGAAGIIAKPYTLHGLNAALKYLQEGIRQPPPTTKLPVGFTLFPSYAERWSGLSGSPTLP